MLFYRRRGFLSVICSFANLHDGMRLVYNNEIAQKVGPSFKLDNDGEQRGVRKDGGQHEGFGLRPVCDLINNESILHFNGRQETYHHSEHAFEACT